MKITGIFVVGAILLISGCGGTGVNGERYTGRQGSQAWFATASPQTIAAYYQQQCAAYGHKPGSPGMTQCIQESAVVGRHSADMRAASFQQGMANAAAVYQASAAASTANRPRQTTCHRFGNSVNCTTF